MPWTLDSTPPLGNDRQQRAVEIRLAVVPVAHYPTGLDFADLGGKQRTLYIRRWAILGGFYLFHIVAELQTAEWYREATRRGVDICS